MAFANNLGYLGIGLKFPLDLNAAGVPSKVAGVDNVIQAIFDILQTPIGTEFFLRERGSRLHLLIYEQNDTVLKGLLRETVKEAIDLWEGRARFVDMQINDGEKDRGVLYLNISVKILSINEVRTFVYPFYQKLKY